MYQLMIVVMAIILSAIVIAGGTNYLSDDIGSRTLVTQRAGTGISIVSTAMASYAGANGGALPRRGSEDVWIDDLSAYLPSGKLPDAAGLTWSFVDDPSGPRICLSTANPTEGVVAGMRSVQAGNPATALASDCLGNGDNLSAQAALSMPARR